MKKFYPLVFAVLLLLVAIISAGCVTLGTQTTDILMGDQKIGSIEITPNQSTLHSLDSSVSDKFDAEIELFGLKYTKDGITEDESAAIYETLSSKNLALINVSEILSGFTPKEASGNAVSAGEDFFRNLLNMPLSAQKNETLSESFNAEDLDKNINNAVQQLENILLELT